MNEPIHELAVTDVLPSELTEVQGGCKMPNEPKDPILYPPGSPGPTFPKLSKPKY